MHSFFHFCNSDPVRIALTEPPKKMTLDFKENWNGKLFNDYFNELTLYSPELHKGAILQINFCGQDMGTAKIETSRTLPFSRVTDAVSYLNMGKPLQLQAEFMHRIHGEGKRLLPDTMLSHIVVGYITRNIEIQGRLIQEWWKSKQLNHVA